MSKETHQTEQEATTYREMHQVELYFCSMNYSRFGKMFWHSRAPNISPGWLDHQASLTLLPTSHVWAIWRVLPSLISFLAIWAICNFTWGFQPLSRLAASLTIGKSLLELWVTTFIPNWQTPLIFVRFISNFLCMFSNSLASAHAILK